MKWKPAPLAAGLFLAAVVSLSHAEPVTEKKTERNSPPPSAGAMVLDGLIYRPLSLASTVLGTGVFLVTLPFSYLGGNAGDAGERLVVEPARDTFTRCLGCLEEYRDPLENF